MKILLAVFLALSFCFDAIAEPAKYVPGVYEVVTRGMDGKIYFEVEFSEDKIVDIRVTKHHETEGLGDVALERVIPAIIEAQSTEVDGKSGATITSNAIKKAVEEAIVMASAPAETPAEEPAEDPEASAPKYVPGVYEVVTRGMDGKIYFEIEFSEDAIVDIRVTKHHETEGLGDVALERVIPAIIEAQSTEVDGKSGATITSNAIKKAVEEAIAVASVPAEAPAEEPVAPEAVAKYVPGVYEVVTRGMDGKIYFEVEFSEDKIVDIRVTKHHETEGLGDVALERVIPAIIEAQSTEVDGKSGATITSNAIKKAVEEAVQMASAAAQ